MQADEVFIFANPIAGRGRGQRIAGRIVSRLTSIGLRARTFFDRPDLVPDASLQSDAPIRAVIAIGGDGTLRAAVQRMFALHDGNAGSIPPILVVALGTANLMARHLGLQWSEPTLDADVAAALLAGQTADLDAATANDRLMLLVAGVGMDAAIVHELDRFRSGPIDYTSYAWPALLALGRYDYPPLRVEMDGELIWQDRPAIAFVGNVPEYGTGFPILTQARSDDGLLDACVLPCDSRAQVLRILMAAATGDHLQEEGVVYRKGRSFRIDSPSPAPVQLDGDAAGHTPLRIDLLAARLRFIVNRAIT